MEAFYVGWRQYNQYMLNVGLDLNNRPSPHVLYYNYQGEWEESNAPGVILLRPFLYDETVGISDPDINSRSLQVYPNPAYDHIYLSLPDESHGTDFRAELYDASGRLALHRVIRDGQLDVGALSGGIYFLKLYAPGQVYHAKVFITR